MMRDPGRRREVAAALCAAVTDMRDAIAALERAGANDAILGSVREVGARVHELWLAAENDAAGREFGAPASREVSGDENLEAAAAVNDGVERSQAQATGNAGAVEVTGSQHG